MTATARHSSPDVADADEGFGAGTTSHAGRADTRRDGAHFTEVSEPAARSGESIIELRELMCAENVQCTRTAVKTNY